MNYHIDYTMIDKHSINATVQSVLIFISEPPKIDKTQNLYKVLLGDMITLPCVIHSGTPVIQVQWKRGGEIIPKRNSQPRSISNIGRGDLPIDDDDYNSEFSDDHFRLLKDKQLRFRVDINDAGEYWCEVKNEAGLDTHEITVIVVGETEIIRQ